MFYNEHTKTHNLVNLSERRLRGKLIQIENKELSKSTIAAVLSQNRKDHHIVEKKGRKNKSCETHYPLEVFKRKNKG